MCVGVLDLRRSYMEVSGTRVLEGNSCALSLPFSRKLLIERVRRISLENIYKTCDGSFEKKSLTSKTLLRIAK